jgi:hypothetical protein
MYGKTMKGTETFLCTNPNFKQTQMDFPCQKNTEGQTSKSTDENRYTGTKANSEETVEQWRPEQVNK